MGKSNEHCDTRDDEKKRSRDLKRLDLKKEKENWRRKEEEMTKVQKEGQVFVPKTGKGQRKAKEEEIENDVGVINLKKMCEKPE